MLTVCTVVAIIEPAAALIVLRDNPDLLVPIVIAILVIVPLITFLDWAWPGHQV